MDYTIGELVEQASDHEGLVFDLGSLYAYLANLTDHRKRRGIRYPLAVVLTIVVLAKLSGEDKLNGVAEWAKLRTEQLASWLQLERDTMPHLST